LIISKKKFPLQTFDFYVGEKTTRPLPPQAAYRDLLRFRFLKKKKNRAFSVVIAKTDFGIFREIFFFVFAEISSFFFDFLKNLHSNFGKKVEKTDVFSGSKFPGNFPEIPGNSREFPAVSADLENIEKSMFLSVKLIKKTTF
jgi:hypothetical protein